MKSLGDWKPVLDRIMIALFKANNASTEQASLSEKESSYIQFHRIFKKIRVENIKFISAVLNAIVGSDNCNRRKLWEVTALAI